MQADISALQEHLAATPFPDSLFQCLCRLLQRELLACAATHAGVAFVIAPDERLNNLAKFSADWPAVRQLCIPVVGKPSKSTND